jgi:spermidine/putrescine transport system ATP-binding protein
MFAKHSEIPKERKGRIDATSGIVLDNVSKDYGKGVMAVNPINLKIGRGEFFSLLGSSGSGKTTTLKMISGLEYPSSGMITLEGVDITHMPANKRDVHTVFQNYALFPHMNVGRNVAYGLEGLHMEKDEIARRVSNMLELVDLLGHEKDSPDSLSGGMQQRVALARALVLEPQALLLDEPLGALDLKLRHHMQEVLKDIHRKVGITFVYVTHDQEEAFSMSDKVAVMSEGNLVQISTPEELYRYPATSFVADFVGASNMLGGIVEKERGSGLYQVHFDETRQSVVVPGVLGLKSGTRILGVVRPQSIHIGEASDDGETIAMNMGVDNRVFLGGYTKLFLKSKDIDLIAHVPQFDASTFDSSAATVSWHLKDMWVVAA